MLTIFRVMQTSFLTFSHLVVILRLLKNWLFISSTFSDEEKDKDQNSLTVKCKLENISS